MKLHPWIWLVLCSTALACADDVPGAGESESSESSVTSATSGTTTSETTNGDGDGDGDGDGTGDGDGEPSPDYWTPGETLPTTRAPNARGYLDRRGLIHAHSVHSHDACDGEPKDDQGTYDSQCDHDFREGLCRARHDFVFLTDHRESYTAIEYPEALLYRPEWGDALVESEGQPIANWTGCEGFEPGLSGDEPFVPTLIQAGCEAATMPIGLPAHVAPSEAERDLMLGDDSPAGIDALRAAGALPLVAHTEEWTVQELSELPLAGFEMYNIHANLFLNIVEVGLLLTKLGTPEAIPHPDLVLLPLLSEDPAYVDTWAAVLATGARRLTTMGTDCHRNTFTEELADGQRIDSYERMMKWFSNHLLVEAKPDAPSEFDAAGLDDALAAGRLFGVFELLGVPEGFDAYAEQSGEIFELGAELSLGAGPTTIHIAAPSVRDRDPDTPTPVVALRLVRATAEGWEEVALSGGLEGQLGSLDVDILEPGAYRAEVRIEPKHLEAWIGSDYGELLDRSFVWIYANPFYVDP